MHDLLSALCLLFVLEGLFLFVAPRAWKRMVVQLVSLHGVYLRAFGAFVLTLGLSALWIVRH